VRRVVFGANSRSEFVQRPGGTLDTVAHSGADGGAARAALEAYLRALKARSLVPAGGLADPDTLERLRSLGYVD
jgi:hypothetical protein